MRRRKSIKILKKKREEYVIDLSGVILKIAPFLNWNDLIILSQVNPKFYLLIMDEVKCAATGYIHLSPHCSQKVIQPYSYSRICGFLNEKKQLENQLKELEKKLNINECGQVIVVFIALILLMLAMPYTLFCKDPKASETCEKMHTLGLGGLSLLLCHIVSAGVYMDPLVKKGHKIREQIYQAKDKLDKLPKVLSRGNKLPVFWQNESAYQPLSSTTVNYFK